ncbi:MAG: hypothetical protein U0892_16800 [Pirellulales bacterium]
MLKVTPSVLGYSGSSWNDLTTLNDLMVDCVVEVIFGKGGKQGQQLLFLKTQIAAGQSIDALVSQNISRFMHDLHRRNFPRENAIYNNLCKAVTTAVEKPQAVLHLLSVEPFGKYGREGETGDAISAEQVAAHIRTCEKWCGTLPRIAQQGSRVLNLAVDAIEEMPKAGQTPFRFDELHGEVKGIAMEQLKSLGEVVRQSDHPEDLGWDQVFSRMYRDPISYSEAESALAELQEQAIRAIDRTPRREAVREKMKQVVLRIVQQIRLESKFSQIELAREMELAPQTLNDYLRFIRQACQAQ